MKKLYMISKRRRSVFKDNYKISIIIPCYNVENLIDRCLTSIINQTIGLSHMEIILINDASTDNTLEKLKQWEQKYSDNIILITYNENLRQGGARNVGLTYATGDYIGFVDSDDWIEPNMYETLVKNMMQDAYDVVKCQLIRDNGDGAEKGYTPEWGGIVTGLYTKELIFDHDIVFPEHMSYEDNFWGALIGHYAKNTCRIERALYHYYINSQSTVMVRNQIAQLDRMKIETMLLDEYKARDFFEADNQQIFDDFLQRYYLNTWFIVFTRFDDIPDILPEMVETFSFYFSDYKERISRKNFTYRSELLINMLLNPAENNEYVVKLKWLEDWLREQGILAR